MDMAVQRDDDKIIVLLSESRHLIFIARLSSRAFFSFCFQVLGARDNRLAGLEAAGRTMGSLTRAL
jgi:hypothetical protein